MPNQPHHHHHPSHGINMGKVEPPVYLGRTKGQAPGPPGYPSGVAITYRRRKHVSEQRSE